MQDDPPNTTEEQDAGAGCGLAIYASMMLALTLTAGGFVLFSTVFIVQAGLEEEPRYLKSGGEVQVRQLQPFRDAGLLGVSDVPIAWYDESIAGDGTTACALTSDALLRVEGGQGTQLSLTELVAVAAEGEEASGIAITARDTAGQTITCTFGPDHGGIRLFRQLEAERNRAR